MKARGSLASRLGRLEERSAARVPAEHERRDEAGWLVVFERLARDGHMDAEPDFPNALVELRQALARAQASVDPPFEPPSPAELVGSDRGEDAVEGVV